MRQINSRNARIFHHNANIDRIKLKRTNVLGIAYIGFFYITFRTGSNIALQNQR